MAQPESANPPPAKPEHPDVMLGMLALLAEKGVSASITVLVGGRVISGMLIGTKAWLDQTISSLAEGMDQAIAGSGDPFREIKSRIEELPQTDRGAPFQCLYLQGAVSLEGNELIPLGLVSVRLESIDGWSGGMMQKDAQAARTVRGRFG